MGAITLGFLALRIPLLLVREPFFDELVTRWIAQKPLAQQWDALAHDSGMPLYYGIARIADRFSGFEVVTGRILSLLFGFAALWICLRVPASPRLRVTAGAAIAVFPPHIFFSTEARAYSLCAFLIGLASVSLYRWSTSGVDRHLHVAATTLLLAAYSHPYGVLFFPLPLVVGLDKRRRRWIVRGAVASAAVALLFLPGFWLARLQPSAAIGWMRGGGVSSLGGTPFLQLGFAAPYPPVLLTPPPVWLQALSFLCVLAIVIVGVAKSDLARFFAMLVLVPVVGIFAFGAAGALVYFPMRFEAVLSVPFALLIGSSVAAARARWAVVVAAVACLIGAAVGVHAFLDHSRRGADPYREVAIRARNLVDPAQPVVASGYAYLELINLVDQQWSPRVTAFPGEQALHPGWRRSPSREQLAREVRSLPPRFVWIGPVQSAEWSAIVEHYRLRVFEGRGFIVAAVAERRSPRSPENGQRTTND